MKHVFFLFFQSPVDSLSSGMHAMSGVQSVENCTIQLAKFLDVKYGILPVFSLSKTPLCALSTYHQNKFLSIPLMNGFVSLTEQW